MNMFKKLIVFLVVILIIGGCSSIKHETYELSVDSNIHPSMPKPVVGFKPKFDVIVIDDVSYVTMSYKDSQDLRVFMNDMFRYIKESNELLCFYRHELKEIRCEGK